MTIVGWRSEMLGSCSTYKSKTVSATRLHGSRRAARVFARAAGLTVTRANCCEVDLRVEGVSRGYHAASLPSTGALSETRGTNPILGDLYKVPMSPNSWDTNPFGANSTLSSETLANILAGNVSLALQAAGTCVGKDRNQSLAPPSPFKGLEVHLGPVTSAHQQTFASHASTSSARGESSSSSSSRSSRVACKKTPKLGFASKQILGTRPYQEDRVLAQLLTSASCSSHGSCGAIGVFDGHGGAGAAERAVKWYPSTLGLALESSSSDEELSGAVESSFTSCDSHLELASMHDAEWDDSGCTASLAVIKEGLLLTANAGDSSTLLVQSGGKVKRFCRLHNTNNVIELIEAKGRGAVVKSGGRDAPARVIGAPRMNNKPRAACMLTRSLGDFSFKYPVRALVAQPEVHSHKLEPGRDLLLMSVTDGVTDVLSDMDLGVIALLAYKEAQRGGGDAHSWANAVADDILTEVERQGLGCDPRCQLDNSSVAVAALEW